MSAANKVVVHLSAKQRHILKGIIHTGKRSAAAIRRASILLKSDADGPDGWSDKRIAQAFDTTPMTVMRVRRQFAAQGLDATLHRKRPTGRQYRKLDAWQEAKLISLARSKPPPGQSRWTVVLLAHKLVAMSVVDSIDPATVWRTLKKCDVKPWLKKHRVTPPKQNDGWPS